MNHENYKKWLHEKLIPNLESKSVIVVDNASYHNVQLNQHPTSNARK
jgi:predicted O-methyltransferase YrrM